MKKTSCLVFAIMLLANASIYAQWTSHRPDGHAPIGIMGDHTHSKGEIMFSYRYMFMDMDGNRDGTDELSTAEILSPTGFNYLITPTQMPMHMHMVGVMYAVSDKLTLAGMVPFVSSEMDHVTRAGGAFTTNSSGIGDIKLSGLFDITRFKRFQVFGQLGISIPTGSIEEMDVTPASAPNEAILPYPMQIGSGTWDVMPAITYLGQSDDFSWGLQSRATLRLGENDNDYTLGNRLDNNFWLGYKLSDNFSPQFRLRGLFFGDIDGQDPRLAGALANNVIHTVDPDLKNGTRIDAGLGLNFFVPSGPLHDLRIGIEYDLPIYQNLDGPQMQIEGIFTIGVQYTIK